MAVTEHYDLQKPAVTDEYAITIINQNMDTIDETVYNLSVQLGNKLNAYTVNGGFTGGAGATVGQDGAAVGKYAYASRGFGGGYAAAAGNGAAIGYNAKTSDGAAVGMNARTETADGAAIDAIQLGEGTNEEPYTLQVYGSQLLDADGNIPIERIADKTVTPEKLDRRYTELQYCDLSTDLNTLTKNGMYLVSASPDIGMPSQLHYPCTPSGDYWEDGLLIVFHVPDESEGVQMFIDFFRPYGSDPNNSGSDLKSSSVGFAFRSFDLDHGDLENSTYSEWRFIGGSGTMATGGFTAGRNAKVATVDGTAIEYMYIGQRKDGKKLSYVSGNPDGLYDKNNTSPPVNSAAQIFNVFDLGKETDISAITLYVADGGASFTNMVCLTNDLTGGRSNYIDVLRTNGEVQNGVPVIENKLSSDGYIKVGYTDGSYIGKYRYVLVYDWSNVCTASELYVETDTAETPIPAIQLGEGTNAEPYSLQVYEHQLLDADGVIPIERIANKSVTSAKYADKSVITSKIADKAVGTQQLADKAVTTQQVGDKAVGTQQLADKCITNYQMNDKAVQTYAIEDEAVTPRKASFTKYPIGRAELIGKWNGQYDIYRTCIFQNCTSAAEDITVDIPGSGATTAIIPINVQLTLWEASTGKIYKLDTDCEMTGTGSKSLKFSKPEGISGQLYGYVEYMDISV